MPSTGLKRGPFPRAEIDLHVKEGTCIGVYVLGRVDDDDGKFIVRYVGRSDNHAEGVRGRLHQHDKDKSKLKSTHFKFDYFSSVKESYDRECRIFHDFEPPDNDAHPPRPAGKKYRCPVSDACFSGDQDEDDG